MHQKDTPSELSDQPSTQSGHIRETGPFRSWVFSREAVLAGTEKFLKYVGYQLQTPGSIGFVQPDLHAKRPEGKKAHEVVAVVRASLEQAVEGYAQLAAIRASLGESADYALVLPPVNEFLLIQFLTNDKGRWFYEIKKLQFMMWLCNPDQEAMWCIVGGPRDRLFEHYFVYADQAIDPYIAMRLSKELMEDEDF